jgi:Cu/Ag efflux pump CusA
VAGAFALVALLVLPFTRTSPVPAFDDQEVLVELTGKPGTSNEAMTATAADLSDTLSGVPGVAGVGAHVGRAITGDRVKNVNSASVWVKLDQDADHDETVQAVEEAVRTTSGADGDVVAYTSQRIRDVGALTTGENRVRGTGIATLTGADDQLVVRVFGQDLTVLRAQADRVRALVAEVGGVVGARSAVPDTEPTIEIEVDLEKAQAHGLTPGHVRRAEATLMQGIQVGSVFEEQKVFDVIVRGTTGAAGGVEAVRTMLIDTPNGGHVRLDQVADVRVVQSPSVIDREAVSRFVDVRADVDGRSVEAVVADIENRLAQHDFPIEYHAEVLTGGTADEIGAGWVLGVAVAAAIAALLLLQALFGSWRVAALVLVTLPLSLVGGLLTGLLDGADLSLGSMLGFLVVFGLATRVSLVLVARLRALEAERPGASRWEIVGQTTRERVAPVVVSSAGLAALMAPFAVLGSGPGLEILHPMALVVLGGVISTVLMALFVTPALYLHLAPPVRYDVSELDGAQEPDDRYPGERSASDVDKESVS